MSSISVVWPPTSPAPNSRGPLLSAPGRRLLPLPVTPFSQTSLPSLEPKISVGPRFECLQTKRCCVTLVSTLPLLHFSPSLVAVVPRLSAIRRVTYALSIFSSSSAPAFCLDSTRVKAWLGSSSLRGYTASAVFSVESVLNSPFVGLPVGFWVILRSGHNPSSLFTPAHRHFVRHDSSSVS